jgi:hypothetical protein
MKKTDIYHNLVRSNLLILLSLSPFSVCSQGAVVVVSIAAHPWHCSSMALGHSRSRCRQPCPWLSSAVLGVVGAVLSHTSSTIVGERLVYIYLCYAINLRQSFASHSDTQAFGHCCCLCLCVLRAQLFFYLGAREERREGEQELLTWELSRRPTRGIGAGPCRCA